MRDYMNEFPENRVIKLQFFLSSLCAFCKVIKAEKHKNFSNIIAL